MRLPAQFHFEGDEVLIRRVPLTGDVILSPLDKSFDDRMQRRDRLLPGIPERELAALDDLRERGPHAERDAP